MRLCISGFRVAWIGKRRSLLVLVLRYSCAAGFAISYHHHYYLQCLHLHTTYNVLGGSFGEQGWDPTYKQTRGRLGSMQKKFGSG